MDHDDDYAVGYGKPPRQHRFRKGVSGNPGGRPPKPKPSNDMRSILERAANEELEFGGGSMTMLEMEIKSLQRKAARGDVAASKHLESMRSKAGVGDQRTGVGVLLIPSPVPLDEWEAAAARQQAKYRERDHGTGNMSITEESLET
jgi:hypothetical protein